MHDLLEVGLESAQEVYRDIPFASNSSPFDVVYLGSNSKDMQYAVLLHKEKKLINVAFRGSESVKDWYHDLYIKKKKVYTHMGKVHVHTGFYTQLYEDCAFETLCTQILHFKKVYEDYDILFSGHSLGGALSTLASFFFAIRFPHYLVFCTSYASPRVGDKLFKNACKRLKNIVHYRCYNAHDVVTFVPILRYFHVGTPIKLSKKSFSINKKSKHSTPITFFWKFHEHKVSVYRHRLFRKF